MTRGQDGLVLLDKPEGPTSHDLVLWVRRATGQRRVGHTGTLDPMASGLLVVVLGRATRLIRYLPGDPKDYTGVIELGRTTDTDDVTGETLERSGSPPPPPERVLAAAAGLRGRSLQRPPAVSARKTAGRRLYALARRGVRVEVEPREIEVRRFDLEPTADPARFRFRARVSSGTYLRALARDLGAALGCGGTLASLRRTAIGPWSVADAIAVDAADPPGGSRIRERMAGLDELPLLPSPLRLERADQAERFLRGNRIEAPRIAAEGGSVWRVLDAEGHLLGIGEPAAGGLLQPRLVLPREP